MVFSNLFTPRCEQGTSQSKAIGAKTGTQQKKQRNLFYNRSKGMRLLFWSKGIGLQKEQRVFTLLALLAVQKTGANVAMTIKSSHF